MYSITQYIIDQGIPEDVFILVLAIPIIFAIIIFSRRIIGLRTFGLYTPLILTVLLIVIGLKKGTILFIITFLPMVVIRYFLKKIALLSLTDSRILDSLVFSILILIIILAFLYVPLFKKIPLNIVILLTIFFMASYSENLITTWEVKRFKRFFSSFIESLSLIIASYLLINSSSIQRAILNYPLLIIIVSIIIIILLAKWQGLKLKEYIEFKEVIKHVELPSKK